MKTLEQILEDVSDGGQWHAVDDKLRGSDKVSYLLFTDGMHEPSFIVTADATYAALAASTWPDLIRALESLESAGRPHGNDRVTGEPCGCEACEVFEKGSRALRKALG